MPTAQEMLDKMKAELATKKVLAVVKPPPPEEPQQSQRIVLVMDQAELMRQLEDAYFG